MWRYDVTTNKNCSDKCANSDDKTYKEPCTRLQHQRKQLQQPNLYMAETLIYQSHLHKQHPHMLSHVNTNYQYILWLENWRLHTMKWGQTSYTLFSLILTPTIIATDFFLIYENRLDLYSSKQLAISTSSNLKICCYLRCPPTNFIYNKQTASMSWAQQNLRLWDKKRGTNSIVQIFEPKYHPLTV